MNALAKKQCIFNSILISNCNSAIGVYLTCYLLCILCIFLCLASQENIILVIELASELNYTTASRAPCLIMSTISSAAFGDLSAGWGN